MGILERQGAYKSTVYVLKRLKKAPAYHYYKSKIIKH